MFEGKEYFAFNKIRIRLKKLIINFILRFCCHTDQTTKETQLL